MVYSGIRNVHELAPFIEMEYLFRKMLTILITPITLFACRIWKTGGIKEARRTITSSLASPLDTTKSGFLNGFFKEREVVFKRTPKSQRVVPCSLLIAPVCESPRRSI